MEPVKSAWESLSTGLLKTTVPTVAAAPGTLSAPDDRAALVLTNRQPDKLSAASSAAGVQHDRPAAISAAWETGWALCRQQGMLQVSAPVQTGARAAARMNIASRTGIDLAAVDFIVSKYRSCSGRMSTRKSTGGYDADNAIDSFPIEPGPSVLPYQAGRFSGLRLE